jgi:hypothetical protein
MLMMVMVIEIVKILRNSSRFHQIERNLTNLSAVHAIQGFSVGFVGYLHATKH